MPGETNRFLTAAPLAILLPMSGQEVDALRTLVERMIVTNTIIVPEEKRSERLEVLSVGDLLAKAIHHVHSNESVSKLFEIPQDN